MFQQIEALLGKGINKHRKMLTHVLSMALDK